MIRSLAISLCLALPASAETPVPISVANDLKACIYDAQGVRDSTRVAQIETSLAQIPNRRWTSKTEVAPGVFHVTDRNRQIVIEFKLRDANGAAHCLAFGPKLGTGQGALTADKFAEFKFMAGLVPAAPAQGMTRRYQIAGAPYDADLVAMQTASQGDVVGFVFSKVPGALTTRALSRNNPDVSYRSVSTSLANAVNICLRNFGNSETIPAALSAYGFEFGFADGRNENKRTYFTPTNSVSIQIQPGICEITTTYLSPSATNTIAISKLNSDASGMFIPRTDNQSGCPGFYAAPALNIPMFINIYNAGQSGRATCNEDGTSRITFGVAG